MLDKNQFKKITGKSKAGIEIETIYPMYERENVLFDIFPNLRSKMDAEGLFDINDLLKEFSILGEPGISDVGYLMSNKTEYVIMLHQCLRSHYSIFNAFGRIMPYLFGCYQENRLPSLKIALDTDRIMLKKDWHSYCRRERYFGPKFTNDIPANKEGQASYLLDERGRLFTNSFKTDFYWKNKKDNSFQLEIEELQDTRYIITPEDIFCKYIHSQYNKTESTFDHLDGSIRKYNSEKYLLRINSNLRNGEVAKKVKLFRVDGKITFDVWKNIISSFMEYNSNIFEYFEAD
jgi:hypothetical protein